MHQGTTATIEEQTEWERDGVLESVGTDFMVERLREFDPFRQNEGNRTQSRALAARASGARIAADA